jgi:hypothetical protein
VAVSGLLALACAACSGSSGDAAPDVTPTVTSTVTPTVTPTAALPTAPATTAAPTPVVPTGAESPAPLGQPTCTPSAVTITDADTVTPRGASYRAEVYVLRTTGAPCQLAGYPTVVVDGATVVRGGEGLPPEAVRPYTLSRTTSLSFALATGRTGSCADRSAITVTLPGTTTPKRVATDLRVCDARLGVTPVHRLGDDE